MRLVCNFPYPIASNWSLAMIGLNVVSLGLTLSFIFAKVRCVDKGFSLTAVINNTSCIKYPEIQFEHFVYFVAPPLINLESTEDLSNHDVVKNLQELHVVSTTTKQTVRKYCQKICNYAENLR